MIIRRVVVACAAIMVFTTKTTAQAPNEGNAALPTLDVAPINQPTTTPIGSGQGPGDAFPARLFVAADVLLYNLQNFGQQALVLNQNSGQTLLSTSDLRFDPQAGLRTIFGVGLRNGTSLEASYFGIQNWSATSAVVGNADLRIPGDLALSSSDFFGASRIAVAYSADVHNAEINYYQRVGASAFEWLTGIRYLELSENLDLHSADTNGGTSDYLVTTKNRSYGAQLGGRWRGQGSVLGFDVTGKVALFGNDARQSNFVGDQDNSIVLRNTGGSSANLAFLGELGVNGTLRLTRSAHLRAGYNVMWLQGVSRAPDQLDFSDATNSGAALRHDSTALFHGANLGLEFRW